MKLKQYLVLVAIISTVLTIYLIYKYGYDWLVGVHWLVVSIPAIYFIGKNKK